MPIEQPKNKKKFTSQNTANMNNNQLMHAYFEDNDMSMVSQTRFHNNWQKALSDWRWSLSWR